MISIIIYGAEVPLEIPRQNGIQNGRITMMIASAPSFSSTNSGSNSNFQSLSLFRKDCLFLPFDAY